MLDAVPVNGVKWHCFVIGCGCSASEGQLHERVHEDPYWSQLFTTLANWECHEGKLGLS